MTTPFNDDRSEPAKVTQQTQSPATTAPSQSITASESTQNEHVEDKNENSVVDLTNDTAMTQTDNSHLTEKKLGTTQEGQPDTSQTDLSDNHEGRQRTTKQESATATSKTVVTSTEKRGEAPTIPPKQYKIVSEDGVQRDQWFDPREDKEDNTEEKKREGTDIEMEEANTTTQSDETMEEDKIQSEDKLEEGEIDEFAQFTDTDYDGVDTEVFQKGTASGEPPLYSAHPTTDTKKTEAEQRKEKMQQETATFMTMVPLKRDSTKPTNIWVHVDVPDGNIEKAKLVMWHDVIKEMFEADPEVKILPRNLKSTTPAFGISDEKIPPMLFPNYITQPKINKTFKNGAVRYEFSFRIRQGIYIYCDLKRATQVRNVLKWYIMSWISSEIYGSSRTRMGFIYGKDPDFAHTSNYGAWLRMKVPRETPPFDLRVEPQTYYYGSSQEKVLVIKLFAAAEDMDQVIAGMMLVIGDMQSPIFFVPRVLSDELQAKFLHQHSQTQRKMKRMDVPSHHLDRPITIKGQITTIRDYVLNLTDPTGASCRLDIEKIVPRHQRQGKRRQFMPTVLMIPHDCPSPNWSEKHVQEVLSKIAYPGQETLDPFRQSHTIPQAMEESFKLRANQVPAPKVNFRGATAKQYQQPPTDKPTTWAEKAKANKSKSQPASATHPPASTVAALKAPIDDMTARLDAMAKEQNAMKVRASNTGITIKGHSEALANLKQSITTQEEALKKTDGNVETVFGILSESQQTQRAFQQKIDTLTGLSVMMYRVLRKQFPKHSGLGGECDPLIEALAADLRGNSDPVNLEEKFAAEDTAAAMDVQDEELTVDTVVGGDSEDEFEDDLNVIEAKLIQISAEKKAIKKAQ